MLALDTAQDPEFLVLIEDTVIKLTNANSNWFIYTGQFFNEWLGVTGRWDRKSWGKSSLELSCRDENEWEMKEINTSSLLV